MQTLVEVYRPINKEGFGMSVIKKVEVLASCRLAMEIPFRVCAAVGIVLLAVSCATTVTLPALDASVTTEAEALVVYTDADYVQGYYVPRQVVRGAGAGASLAAGEFLKDGFPRGGSCSGELCGGAYVFVAAATLIALPFAAATGAAMAHSIDEVDAAAIAFNSVWHDMELLTSIDRRFVEALDTDTTKQWVCVEASSVAKREPCSGETHIARLELRPIFELTMEGKYDPDITFTGSVRAFASMEGATSDVDSGVEVYAEWMYREDLGDYFELAKFDADLLVEKIEIILDRFADRIADDLYLAPGLTTFVGKTEPFQNTAKPELPDGVVIRVN